MIYKCLSPEIIIDSELVYQNTPITTLTFEIKEHLNTILQDEILTIMYPINELFQKMDINVNQSTLEEYIKKDIFKILNHNNIDFNKLFVNVHNLSETVDFNKVASCETDFNKLTDNIYTFKIDNLNSNYIVTKIDYLAYLFENTYLIRSFLQNPIDETFYIICINRNKNKFENKQLISKNVDNIIDIYINYISEVQVAVDIALGIKYDAKINHFEGIDINNETLYAIYLKKLINEIK